MKLFKPTKFAYAHCDLPCGVYDPAQARIEAESVLNAAKKYQDSDDASFKQRCVTIKEERAEEDFSEVIALINKYKAVEVSLKKAEYFVNVSYDSLAIFPESEDKKILQNLTNFSLNRSF